MSSGWLNQQTMLISFERE